MNKATLSKRVPARTKTEDITWVKRNFQEMSPRFREIREKVGDKFIGCFWCKHKFIDGEQMALAGRKGKLNGLMCQSCVEKIDGLANVVIQESQSCPKT